MSATKANNERSKGAGVRGAMSIERVLCNDLTQDPLNARSHDRRNIDAIKASLDAWGQQKPIVVDGDSRVVAGNGTLVAAQELGWSHIDIHRTTLTGADAVAYAIADNQTASLASWDDEQLAKSLSELQNDQDFDHTLTGFDDKDIEDLILSVEGPVLVDEDEVPQPPDDPVTQSGDVWMLGEHRVMCGDATDDGDVGKVMQDEVAMLIHTDPPYGIGYQSNMRKASPKFEVIENDDTILTDWIPRAIERSAGWVFIWTTWKVLGQWIDVVKPFGQVTNMVIWHKGGGGIGDLKHTFSTDYEIAIVFSRGAELCGKRIGSVWSFSKDAPSLYLHPTQKPVALAGEAIDKTTHRSDVVYDPFLGSGTTLIAAEQLGRRCYGLEISPAYCDVIVQRWEKLTGNQAVREGKDV